MTKSYRAALTAASCVALLAGGAAPAGAETLAEAIALAYQTNPTLRAQRAQQRALDETVIQARAAYAPTLDASAVTNFTQSLDNGVDSNSASAALRAQQNIYSGGRIASSVQTARADVVSGREQLREIEANVLLSVVQAYVDIRRDEEALRIRTDNVVVLQRQLEEAGARFEVGEITRTDVEQSRARLALSQANLAVAQATLANSRARYSAVVGQNPGQLAPEPALPPLPASVDEAYAIAEAENPTIRRADAAETAARARVRAARSEFAPTVGLSASLSGAQAPVGIRFDDFVDRSASVDLNASIPLFTGGLNASRVRQALESENSARFQIDAARRSVLNDVAVAWNGVLAARASFIANQEQVRATTVAFEGVQAEFQVGLRTTLDVLNAQQELRNAELLLVNARRDTYVAEASVLSAMGRLEAPNLIGDVPLYDPTYVVQRRGLRDGQLPYEGLLERLDERGVSPLERPNRIVPPVVEAPFTPGGVWRPRSAPVVVPKAPPPSVSLQPAVVPAAEITTPR